CVLRGGVVSACDLCLSAGGVLVGAGSGLGAAAIVRPLPCRDRSSPATATVNLARGQGGGFVFSWSLCRPGGSGPISDRRRVLRWGGIVESIPEQGLLVRGDVHRLRTDGPLFWGPFGTGYAGPHGTGLRAPQARLHHARP